LSRCDPIKLFESTDLAAKIDMEGANTRVKAAVKAALDFARDSPEPAADLAKVRSRQGARPALTL
jgi:hypothetical protein